MMMSKLKPVSIGITEGIAKSTVLYGDVHAFSKSIVGPWKAAAGRVSHYGDMSEPFMSQLRDCEREWENSRIMLTCASLQWVNNRIMKGSGKKPTLCGHKTVSFLSHVSACYGLYCIMSVVSTSRPHVMCVSGWVVCARNTSRDL